MPALKHGEEGQRRSAPVSSCSPAIDRAYRNPFVLCFDCPANSVRYWLRDGLLIGFFLGWHGHGIKSRPAANPEKSICVCMCMCVCVCVCVYVRRIGDQTVGSVFNRPWAFIKFAPDRYDWSTNLEYARAIEYKYRASTAASLSKRSNGKSARAAGKAASPEMEIMHATARGFISVAF